MQLKKQQTTIRQETAKQNKTKQLLIVIIAVAIVVVVIVTFLCKCRLITFERMRDAHTKY